MDRERLRRARERQKGRRQKDIGEGDRVTEWEGDKVTEWEGDRWKERQKKVQKKVEEEIEEETVQ